MNEIAGMKMVVGWVVHYGDYFVDAFSKKEDAEECVRLCTKDGYEKDLMTIFEHEDWEGYFR